MSTDAEPTVESQLPWKQPENIYMDDGPVEPVEFEVRGHKFTVESAHKMAGSTGRARFRVHCVTCDKRVHDATTSATCMVEHHLRTGD